MNTRLGDGFTPINSGHMEAVKYDSMEKRLTVRFANGSEYHVYGFSPEHYDAFMSAPSQGAHYHSEIKNNFDVKRVK